MKKLLLMLAILVSGIASAQTDYPYGDGVRVFDLGNEQYFFFRPSYTRATWTGPDAQNLQTGGTLIQLVGARETFHDVQDWHVIIDGVRYDGVTDDIPRDTNPQGAFQAEGLIIWDRPSNNYLLHPTHLYAISPPGFNIGI